MTFALNLIGNSKLLISNLRGTCAVTSFCFLLSACGQASFEGGGGKGTVKPRPPKVDNPSNTKEGNAEQLQEQSFDLAKKNSKIDIVWAIDTSGSMAEEAAQVQRNLGSFTSSVSARSDVRLTVIANKSKGVPYDISVDLNSQSVERQQIDLRVGSTNALAILAASICGAQELAPSPVSGLGLYNPPATVKICGQSFPYIEAQATLPLISSNLLPRLRADAKLVTVVVTDDDAGGVDSKNFLSLINSQLNGRSPTVFAFRGAESRSGCNIAKRGYSYEQLAASTGGKVFDICEPDWSANFSTLVASVTELATLSFSLKSPVKTVESVVVDGRKLATSDYTISGQTLELKKGVVTTANKSIVVKWKSQ